MSVEFFTGFEGCGSTNECLSLFDGYGEAGYIPRWWYSATGGWENGKSIYGRNSWTWKNLTPGRTKVVGSHVRNFSDDSGTDLRSCILAFRLDDGVFIYLGHTTSDGFTVRRDGTLIADTVQTISTGLHHLEFKVYVHPTEGTVQLKVDGVLVIDEDNVNTGDANIDRAYWSTKNISEAIYSHHDNIFVADDWHGELKSHLLLPTADDLVEFTPSTGSDNYALLQSNDGDTSYVESDVVGEQDMYEFGPDLAMFAVHAVSIVSVARKTDVGARNLQTVMEYDGVEHDLANHSLSEGFPSGVTTGLVQCYGESPAGDEWAQDLINSLKLGYKVA